MAVRRFQDLDAWKLANELKIGIYKLINGSDARLDRSFCDQIRSSAASPAANLAEGFGLYRHPEFARHTRIAKASLLETQNHLSDGVDRGYWSDEDVMPLHKLADRAIGASVRLLAYLETTDAPGSARAVHRGTTFTARAKSRQEK